MITIKEDELAFILQYRLEVRMRFRNLWEVEIVSFNKSGYEDFSIANTSSNAQEAFTKVFAAMKMAQIGLQEIKFAILKNGSLFEYFLTEKEAYQAVAGIQQDPKCNYRNLQIVKKIGKKTVATLFNHNVVPEGE